MPLFGVAIFFFCNALRPRALLPPSLDLPIILFFADNGAAHAAYAAVSGAFLHESENFQ